METIGRTLSAPPSLGSLNGDPSAGTKNRIRNDFIRVNSCLPQGGMVFYRMDTAQGAASNYELPITHHRMFPVPVRRTLIFFCGGEQPGLTKQLANKADAGRRARLGKPVRQDHAGV